MPSIDADVIHQMFGVIGQGNAGRTAMKLSGDAVPDAADELPKPSDRPAFLPPMRVLLVDDHDIVREGIAGLLNRAGGIEVVGFAGSGEEAVQAAKHLSPDVVVMDLVLPVVNGIDATRRILNDWPQMHIVVLSACHTTEHVHRALRAGARGYVTKHSAGSDLVLALKTVIAGRQYISPGILPMSTDGLSSPKSTVAHLSAREREVLRLLVAGQSSAEIARHLSLSPNSVDTYRHRLMVKLGVANRAGLIRLAVAYDLISV